jgi:hypothetical protein
LRKRKKSLEDAFLPLNANINKKRKEKLELDYSIIYLIYRFVQQFNSKLYTSSISLST